jgi:hypothetical protein
VRTAPSLMQEAGYLRRPSCLQTARPAGPGPGPLDDEPDDAGIRRRDQPVVQVVKAHEQLLGLLVGGLLAREPEPDAEVAAREPGLWSGSTASSETKSSCTQTARYRGSLSGARASLMLPARRLASPT